MSFDDTLYGRDDEMDDFGDSSAYGDNLEETLEEEEEEEEEVEAPAMGDMPTPPPPAPPAPGWCHYPQRPAQRSSAWWQRCPLVFPQGTCDSCDWTRDLSIPMTTGTGGNCYRARRQTSRR